MDTLLQTIGPDTRHIFPSVMEYLVQRDWKKTFELKGLLAEKWEQVKPDTWRYTLRKGIKFQNGEPFNADAVVFSLGKIADKDSGAQLQRYWPAGGKVTKVDDYTVDLTSSMADPIQPLRMQYLPSVPPKWAQDNPEERPVKLIGTGP
jgi:peptide/nickel transport system substrate-binding protein